eukprot:gene9912-1788_t
MPPKKKVKAKAPFAREHPALTAHASGNTGSFPQDQLLRLHMRQHIAALPAVSCLGPEAREAFTQSLEGSLNVQWGEDDRPSYRRALSEVAVGLKAHPLSLTSTAEEAKDYGHRLGHMTLPDCFPIFSFLLQCRLA